MMNCGASEIITANRVEWQSITQNIGPKQMGKGFHDDGNDNNDDEIFVKNYM